MNKADVDELEWVDWNHGDRFGGRSKRISDAAGGQRLGVVLEELPPGRKSSPAHYHLGEEEHIWILNGAVTLKLGKHTHQLRKGHYVSFLAGVPEEHTLINETDMPCLYLVIGERRKDDVVVYPDSAKVLVRHLDRVYMDRPVDYWADE